MLSPFEFGVAIGQQAFQKSAAGAKPGGLFGAALGALSNMGKPAVKATANMGAQLPPPRLPLKPGATPASLERTTGTILNSAGVPVPKKAPPAPVAPPSRNWGTVPTGPTPTAQMQSFFDNATGAGRQRMLGLDPQARPAPAAAPQSWSQLSPAQQQAVQRFYSGGQ